VAFLPRLTLAQTPCAVEICWRQVVSLGGLILDRPSQFWTAHAGFCRETASRGDFLGSPMARISGIFSKDRGNLVQAKNLGTRFAFYVFPKEARGTEKQSSTQHVNDSA
jgi:hypothetical protein